VFLRYYNATACIKYILIAPDLQPYFFFPFLFLYFSQVIVLIIVHYALFQHSYQNKSQPTRNPLVSFFNNTRYYHKSVTFFPFFCVDSRLPRYADFNCLPVSAYLPATTLR